MITNLLPTEATHSTLDIFEKPSLLIAFENGFEQRVGPAYTANGPTLEFKVIGDRHNFINMQQIFLELSCCIKKADGTNMTWHATEAPRKDAPVFVNNVLHSLFSDCDIYANGVKISSANGVYGHKSFLETELSHTRSAKNTWLKCQGYTYEENPSQLGDGSAVRQRNQQTRESQVIKLYGKLAVDFFTCEKLLLPNVSLRIKLVRARDDFVTISENAGKHYSVEITNANLFVRKMTVTDSVYTSIERALLKSPAIYEYTEVMPKTFVIPAQQNTWKHEDIFMKEPIRRLAIAMNTNTAFGASNMGNPYNYGKFGLRSITVFRNGIPIVGTPMDTEDVKRAYFKSIQALAYVQSSHDIPLEHYENHFVLVFDLTSTLEASQDFIHPELTNCSITLEMVFDDVLNNPLEIFVLGEKASTVFIDSQRNVSKNALFGTNG